MTDGCPDTDPAESPTGQLSRPSVEQLDVLLENKGVFTLEGGEKKERKEKENQLLERVTERIL